MEDNKKTGETKEAAVKGRRKFLKSAARVAVTAPVVVMLLNAEKSMARTMVECYGGTDAFQDGAMRGPMSVLISNIRGVRRLGA